MHGGRFAAEHGWPEVWKRMANTSQNKVYTNTADISAKRVKKDRQRIDGEAGK